MMDNQNYKPHIFALTAQFIMGNAIVTLPFYKSENAFFVFLISVVITTAFTATTALIIKRGNKNKAAFYITAAAVGVLSLYGVATTAYDYLRFIKNIQLPQTNIALTATALISVVIIFATSSNSAVYKFCVLSAVFSTTAVIIIIAGGISIFDTSCFKISFDLSHTTLTDAFKIFLRCFSSTAAAVAFVYFTKQKTNVKTWLWGTVAGFAALALCLVQSVLTLGISSGAEYPYIKAVSVISSGSLFTRLDGLVYWIFFVAVLIKAVVCVKAVILIIKRIIHNRLLLHC